MVKEFKKWFWIWDFDKEEKWLNEMSQKGWKLISIYRSLGYSYYKFENCLPGEFIFRKQLLKNKINHPENLKYLSFLKETGAEVIEYQPDLKYVWVYLCKKASDGPLELYSDKDSKIKQYSRVINYLNISLATNFFNLLLLIYSWYNLFDGLFKYDKMYTFWVIPICVSVVLFTLLLMLDIKLLNCVIILRRKRKELQKEKNIYQ